MKYAKILAVIVVPVLLAAMFGNAIYSIGNALQLFENGVNYTPIICALSFFSFWGFFVATANLIYPDNNVAAIQEQTTLYTGQEDVIISDAKEPIYVQPCVMQLFHVSKLA